MSRWQDDYKDSTSSTFPPYWMYFQRKSNGEEYCRISINDWEVPEVNQTQRPGRAIGTWKCLTEPPVWYCYAKLCGHTDMWVKKGAENGK